MKRLFNMRAGGRFCAMVIIVLACLWHTLGRRPGRTAVPPVLVSGKVGLCYLDGRRETIDVYAPLPVEDFSALCAIIEPALQSPGVRKPRIICIFVRSSETVDIMTGFQDGGLVGGGRMFTVRKTHGRWRIVVSKEWMS